MYRLYLFFILCLFLTCSENDNPPAPDEELLAMVEGLEQVYHPLSDIPLDWQDEELSFLAPLSERKIIGLGEATHGTAEFFEAKHRIFRYLVENHGYKVFAIEADFGESLFINEAVQTGNKAALPELMKEKMHFWTWQTEEVKAMLEWMCDYNQDRPENERLQYVGVDCQYNTYHPGKVIIYLDGVAPNLTNDYASLLIKVQNATQSKFSSYTDSSFYALLARVDSLSEAMKASKEELVMASSLQGYELHRHLLEVSKQAAIVNYAYANDDNSQNYRDRFMAENTLWWQEHLGGSKTVVWGHNAHIAVSLNYDALGLHLRQSLEEGYLALGFSFSRGQFTAVSEVEGLQTQTIDETPPSTSINGIFDQVEAGTFAVEIIALESHSNWNDFLGTSDITMLNVGSLYNGATDDYYWTFRRTFYDWLIYFDQTEATRIL